MDELCGLKICFFCRKLTTSKKEHMVVEKFEELYILYKSMRKITSNLKVVTRIKFKYSL